jgi:hypothetical protein
VFVHACVLGVGFIFLWYNVYTSGLCQVKVGRLFESLKLGYALMYSRRTWQIKFERIGLENNKQVENLIWTLSGFQIKFSKKKHAVWSVVYSLNKHKHLKRLLNNFLQNPLITVLYANWFWRFLFTF